MGVLYNSRIVTDGLVFCLDAGDKMSYPGAGTTWTDLSKNKNNGTLTNGPTFDGANGGSIVLDGTNDYISASTPTISQPVSISLWFKTNDSRGQIIDGDDATDRLAIYFVSNQLYFFNGTSDKLVGAVGDYNDGAWHHIVVMFDTTAKVYIDGVLVSTQSAGGNQLSGIILGARYSLTEYLIGSIQSVHIYNRALSAEEIRQNYKATKGRFGL